MFDIDTELKKLPDKPGVYIMHDAQDRILYVGKAVVLKNRVRQYFQKGYKRSPKIEKMVSHIAWFEYIITDSETEALVLECNLIKEHRPPYNTMLTDDKAYPFIRVSVNEAYPRVFLARKIKRDGSKYFGPYTSHGAVRDTIKLVQKLFMLRSCSRSLPEDTGKARPCLNYHIGLCKGPCQGSVSSEEYKKQIDGAIDFLNGNYDKIKRELKGLMNEASSAMDFEAAANYRDEIAAIESLEECQKISSTDGDDRDIIAIAREEKVAGSGEAGAGEAGEGEAGDGEAGAGEAGEGDDLYGEAVAQIFFVREGKLIGRDSVHIRTAGDDDAQVAEAMIKQFYAGTPFLPHEILMENEPADAAALTAWLSSKAGHQVEIKIPQRGDKHKLLAMAAENARLLLSQNKEQLKREEARTSGAVKELSRILGIPGLFRMEAYDISNISGFQSVGSMVVFEGGKPRRNDYRKFRIKTVEGPNDYASLYEVITRRFEHGLSEKDGAGGGDSISESGTFEGDSFNENGGLSEGAGIRGSAKAKTSFSHFPDVIMMDGGKGQVNVCLEALSALGLNIPVCGMVKDDNHRTRGLYYNGEELAIDKRGEVFHMITRLQDEAHRFAIEYHRSLRGKNQVHSVLDDIPGIGPARRKALMREFKDIDEIKSADYNRLLGIPEINKSAAAMIHAYFHDGDTGEVTGETAQTGEAIGRKAEASEAAAGEIAQAGDTGEN